MAQDDAKVLREILAEMVDIKTLLVLALTDAVQNKLSQDVVARALGINQASVSRMLSAGKKRDEPAKRARPRRRDK